MLRQSLFSVFVLLFAVSCLPASASEGQILSVTISPNVIATSDTGMSDEFFTIEIETTGFTDPIDVDETQAYFFDGDEQTDAVYQSARLDGDTIILESIFTSWFGAQPAGSYEIGVTVNTELGITGRPTASVSEFGLATVTITE